MFQLWVVGARNLLQHRRRTFLLGTAIAAVTALLVILLSLSNGMQATLMRSATTLVTGHLNVGGFFKLSEGQSAPVVTGYKDIQEHVKTALGDELAYTTHRGRGWAKLVSETGGIQVGVGGIDIESEPGVRETLKMVEGSLEGLKEPGSLLLFADQAKKLAVQVGDVVTLSAPTLRGVNNTLDLKVVGVAQDVGLLSSMSVFIPAASLRALYQLNENSTGAVHIYLHSTENLSEARGKVRTALERAGYRLLDSGEGAFWMKFQTVNREAWTGQKLDVTTWEDEVFYMRFALLGLNGLSFILTIVLLVIISAGLMNTLWVSIRERTREIGTLRAIGMQRRGVLSMFLIEAFILAVGGTVAGAALGLVTCALVNAAEISVPLPVQLFLMTDTVTLVPAAAATSAAMVLIVTCTTLVSLLPSFLAARMRPVTAMHHVG